MTNIEIGFRISGRRNEIDMTMDDLAKKVGVAKSTIQRYEKGNIKKIKLPVIESIGNALGVNPSWIIGKSEDKFLEPEFPKNIIPLPKMKKLPLVGAIACGQPILAEEHIEEFMAAPEDVNADFCLRCKGDSMINARIFDGDIVYIRQQETVDNGQIAAVLVDGGEATLKRVRLFEDHISLEPENPMYKPLVFWNEEMNQVRILGRAVAFTSVVC